MMTMLHGVPSAQRNLARNPPPVWLDDFFSLSSLHTQGLRALQSKLY